ncbi:hypothetical protein DUE52_18120 [Larkinella punicea]|uniref:Uncharacterized protein n=2 Tax=Larkinella punicea TaxID=2315727 RepID=A0A368JLA1_9BACT|nr:hypothetical protein DUE52_18120 [Larkinella punicea]
MFFLTNGSRFTNGDFAGAECCNFLTAIWQTGKNPFFRAVTSTIPDSGLPINQTVTLRTVNELFSTSDSHFTNGTKAIFKGGKLGIIAT